MGSRPFDVVIRRFVKVVLQYCRPLKQEQDNYRVSVVRQVSLVLVVATIDISIKMYMVIGL